MGQEGRGHVRGVGHFPLQTWDCHPCTLPSSLHFQGTCVTHHRPQQSLLQTSRVGLRQSLGVLTQVCLITGPARLSPATAAATAGVGPASTLLPHGPGPSAYSLGRSSSSHHAASRRERKRAQRHESVGLGWAGNSLSSGALSQLPWGPWGLLT